MFLTSARPPPGGISRARRCGPLTTSYSCTAPQHAGAPAALQQRRISAVAERERQRGAFAAPVAHQQDIGTYSAQLAADVQIVLSDAETLADVAETLALLPDGAPHWRAALEHSLSSAPGEVLMRSLLPSGFRGDSSSSSLGPSRTTRAAAALLRCVAAASASEGRFSKEVLPPALEPVVAQFCHQLSALLYRGEASLTDGEIQNALRGLLALGPRHPERQELATQLIRLVGERLSEAVAEVEATASEVCCKKVKRFPCSGPMNHAGIMEGGVGGGREGEREVGGWGGGVGGGREVGGRRRWVFA